jgi:flagellar biosynthesis/type III secretory pathway chaperone
MESMSERIEEAYGKKVSLLQSLLECLNVERENLIQVDVKALWSVMQEKEKILSSIQEAEEEISACRAESPEGIPDRGAVRGFLQEIRRLKQEIGARVRENVSFIEESLQFFDEVIAIFASGNTPECGYGPVLQKKRTPTSLIYESEA